MAVVIAFIARLPLCKHVCQILFVIQIWRPLNIKALFRTLFKRAHSERGLVLWAVIEVDSDWLMSIIAFLSCLSRNVCVHEASLDGGWRFVLYWLVIFVIRYPLYVISSQFN